MAKDDGWFPSLISFSQAFTKFDMGSLAKNWIETFNSPDLQGIKDGLELSPGQEQLKW